MTPQLGWNQAGGYVALYQALINKKLLRAIAIPCDPVGTKTRTIY